MDNNKFIQFLKQVYKKQLPSELHWYARVDGENKVTEIMVEDKNFNDRYTANPSDYPDIKPATESTSVGDTL